MEISQQPISGKNEKQGFQNEITSLKKEIENLKRKHLEKCQIPTRRKATSFPTSKRAPEKNSNNKFIRIYSKNHDNFIRLRKTIIMSILLRNDPNGNVINLSKYSFAKGQNNLLNNKFERRPNIRTEKNSIQVNSALFLT